jgi:hypothetical protein
MKTVTLLLLLTFMAAYGAAVVMLVTGTLGWFGDSNDALATAFLMPLGLPWNLFAKGGMLIDRAIIAVAAPMLNLLLLWLLYRSSHSMGN